jgi:Tfp pilus assembly protein PilF
MRSAQWAVKRRALFARCPLRAAHCALLLVLLAPAAFAQTTRIASDFEIQQMEKQAASAHDFLSQLSARLNLGDLRLTRSETSVAQSEYQTAADIAQRERTGARKSSDLARYATATMYAALAAAKLGDERQAFTLIEEATRYASDDAKTWNVYASVMRALQRPRKAASAARNAVMVAEAGLLTSPSTARRLDLDIYRFSLATALDDAGERDEAQRLLETVVASLRSKDFDALRKDAARRESFEIYSTARGETTAYLSLLNRSQLQMAATYERSGNVVRARQVYHDVLTSRSDDATALTALARLGGSAEERTRSYADAFDANPFSIDLIRDYQSWLSQLRVEPNDGVSNGAVVRRALEQMARGENRAARSTLDALVSSFPQNDVVQYLAATNDIALGDVARARSHSIHVEALRREVESRLASSVTTAPAFLDGAATSATPSGAELRSLLAALQQQRLTPEEHLTLDRITLTSTAMFDASAGAGKPGQCVFESGTIEGVAFRFSEPMAFAGTFAPATPLRLSYRVLGATEVGGGDGLLLEPVKLEVPR